MAGCGSGLDHVGLCRQNSGLTLSGRPALCEGWLSMPPWQPLIKASVAVAKGWDVAKQTILEGRLPVPTHPGRLSEQPKCMQASGQPQEPAAGPPWIPGGQEWGRTLGPFPVGPTPPPNPAFID